MSLQTSDYLNTILQPNPTGAASLIAAWDGLGAETQIRLLKDLNQAQFPAYLADRIRTKALDSPNGYVRYLAAREFHFSEDDPDEKKQIKQRIEQDSDPLVSYCLLERGHIGDPQSFFSLPHQARLACVRRLTGGGEGITALIEYALDHQLRDGTLSEIELFEILSDYVNRDEFKEHYNRYHGFREPPYAEYLASKEIEALWRLVLKVPERISHVLIENLPPESGFGEIPEDVLSGMTDSQLATLFLRPDIELEDFRKEVFFNTNDSRARRKDAAVRHNFNLEYEEFARILEKPEQQKIEILSLLLMANNLRLCILDAIKDALSARNSSSALDDEVYASAALKRNLSKLTGWQREWQIRELRLYRLARQALGGPPLADDLAFLTHARVPGNTWATFMRMSEAWARRPRSSKKLESQLPRIYGIEGFEEDVDPHEDELVDSPAERSGRRQR